MNGKYAEPVKEHKHIIRLVCRGGQTEIVSCPKCCTVLMRDHDNEAYGDRKGYHPIPMPVRKSKKKVKPK